jgi:hypothetical protein
MKNLILKLLIIAAAIFPQITFAQHNGFIWVCVKDGHPYLMQEKTEKIIVAPIYDGVCGSDKYGLIINRGKNSKEIAIEEDGFMNIRCNKNFLTVMKKNKWAIADTCGKPITPFIYDMIVPSCCGNRALVKIGKNFGLLNHLGASILEVKYQIPYLFLEDGRPFTAIATGFLEDGYEKSYLETEIGEDWEWDMMGWDDGVLFYLDDNLTFFQLGGLLGAVDQAGGTKIPFIYEMMISTNSRNYIPSSVYKCRRNNKWGMVDTTGKETVECKYDTLGAYMENNYSARVNNKWGWFDYSNGREIIPCLYEELGEISENTFAVKLNGKWGYLGVNAEPLTGIIYEKAGRFNNGIAKVVLNDKKIRIDKTGKIVE